MLLFVVGVTQERPGYLSLLLALKKQPASRHEDPGIFRSRHGIWDIFAGYGHATTQDGKSRPGSLGLRRLEVVRLAHSHCPHTIPSVSRARAVGLKLAPSPERARTSRQVQRARTRGRKAPNTPSICGAGRAVTSPKCRPDDLPTRAVTSISREVVSAV